MNHVLHKIKNPNISRRWSKEQLVFLEKNTSELSTIAASNLLYRSRYAVYEKEQWLGVYIEMKKYARN